MTPYFSTSARRESLQAEARLWVGTPFKGHIAQVRHGADCVHLVLSIYRTVGLIDGARNLPGYTLGAGSHLDCSAVSEWVTESGRFERVEAPAAIGDLLGFRIGRVIHHVGIVVGGDLFVHAVERVGVIESRISDSTWAKRLCAIWRPIEP